MKKGIAIQTILMLTIGVIVVGILAYMVYSYTSGSALSVNECRAKLIDVCTRCMVAGCLSSTPTYNPCAYIDFSSEVYSTTDGCAQYEVFRQWSNNYDCWSGTIIEECEALGVKD